MYLKNFFTTLSYVMNSSHIPTLLILLILIGLPLSGQKPNIVFILADDLGWRDAGFMGSKYYEPPEIDKLAGTDKIFTDAYINIPQSEKNYIFYKNFIFDN